MREKLKNLDDAKAKDILLRVATVLEGENIDSEWLLVMEQALRDVVGASPNAGRASEGELARQALILLAEDPAYQQPICDLIAGPAAMRFGSEVTIALIPAVLLVLQTHMRFKRDKTGKWEILIEKKPTQTELLKPLVEKLLSLARGR